MEVESKPDICQEDDDDELIKKKGAYRKLQKKMKKLIGKKHALKKYEIYIKILKKRRKMALNEFNEWWSKNILIA